MELSFDMSCKSIKIDKSKSINSTNSTNSTNSINSTNLTNSTNITKPKKNISLLSKKIIKIKPPILPKSISMIEAIKKSKVKLWGTYQIDSICLNNYKLESNTNTESESEQEIIFDSNLCSIVSTPTLDKEFDSSHKYNLCDLDFLNNEYDRIEELLKNPNEPNYEKFMDLQDELTDLINEMNENKKNIKIEINEPNKQIKLNELNESDESNIKTKSTKLRKIKPKPYYKIGPIPEGYRECTQEEAIINKQVGLYGINRVDSKLTNMFEQTGTIYIKNLDIKQLETQISALKGKMCYYKKKFTRIKQSLDSDIINENKNEYMELEEKIEEIKLYFKKTQDIHNIYVGELNKQNNLIKNSIKNKIEFETNPTNKSINSNI